MNYGWLSDQGKEIRDQGSWIRYQGSRITADNWHFLLSRLFYSNDVVPFVVTYNPALPRISNFLRKHFNILHSDLVTAAKTFLSNRLLLLTDVALIFAPF